MLVWFDDPHQYPDKLLDVTDIANDLGQRYGGWYPGLESFAKRGNQFVALPLAAIANAICYRESMVKEAGFSEFPKDTKAFLELAKALKAKSKPMGLRHGKAVGDGNNFAHWIVWSHGGKMVDESGKVTINSPRRSRVCATPANSISNTIPGTNPGSTSTTTAPSWPVTCPVTANGVSLYYSAKNDPKMADLAKDIKTAQLPVGPVGQPVELHQTTQAVIFKHTKFPNAARAYLQFMFEKPQMDAWITASSAYCCPPLKSFIDNPVWGADPNHAPYAKASESLRPNGYAGPLGPASAAVMADYVMVDMVAEAATGQRTPEEAARRAEQRATRAYRNA
jgi:multiple sugar transport system substrate-binding protein